MPQAEVLTLWIAAFLDQDFHAPKHESSRSLVPERQEAEDCTAYSKTVFPLVDPPPGSSNRGSGRKKSQKYNASGPAKKIKPCKSVSSLSRFPNPGAADKKKTVVSYHKMLRLRDRVEVSVTKALLIQGCQSTYHFKGPISREGKFGVVERWDADDGSGNRQPFAIKFLPTAHEACKGCKYPIREILWLSSLAHPHIVEFVELVLVGEHLGIVMEYLSKGSFRDLLRARHRKPLDENLARWYFHQLVVILDFLHRAHGVTHRDIKPENILVSDDGNLKMADFGMSKHVSMDSAMITELGTRNYAAPEVRNSGPSGYDGRIADIWSLGAVLYEMLHGYRITSEGRPQEGRVNLSPDARDLVQRMMLTDPKQRITLEQIKEHPWFKVNFDPAVFELNVTCFRRLPQNLQSEQDIHAILNCAFPSQSAGGADEQPKLEVVDEEMTGTPSESFISSISKKLKWLFRRTSSEKRQRTS